MNKLKTLYDAQILKPNSKQTSGDQPKLQLLINSNSIKYSKY